MDKVKKLNYISFLQFIGPIFVIIGHAMNGLEYNSFLNQLKDWIYIFHMPLFFFMSGYLFFYRDSLKTRGYKEFIKNKFLRLLFPYLILNIIAIIPKILASEFINDQVQLSFGYFLYIFFTPRANIWGHLWFLCALFLVYLISPIFEFIKNNKNKFYWFGLILFALLIFMLRPLHTDFLAINDLQKNLIFFVLGMLLTFIPIEKIKAYITKSNFFILIIFDILLSIIWIFNKELLILQLLIGLNTIFILFSLPIVFNINNRFIMKQANYSFAIYILHWPIILGIRIVLYQILKFNSLIVFFIQAICGYLIPNLIIYVANKIKNKYKIKNTKIIYYLIGL